MKSEWPFTILENERIDREHCITRMTVRNFLAFFTVNTNASIDAGYFDHDRCSCFLDLSCYSQLVVRTSCGVERDTGAAQMRFDLLAVNRIQPFPGFLLNYQHAATADCFDRNVDRYAPLLAAREFGKQFAVTAIGSSNETPRLHA